ncbi:pentapeptide repeat-containing protein [Bdellovibrio sp. ArHS]|uniref:pentapeptide repeat-containing protein n=1 Tax=Bdellovibrio sp. ArHS TaxID=1569284 RepID=UPI000B2A47DB|nr:pentapeptide repeat-containing protein [Bdellovibrio sp. ArHS]
MMRHWRIFWTVFIFTLTVAQSSSGLTLSASPLSGKSHPEFDYSEKPLGLSQIINAQFTKSSFILNNWFQMSFKNVTWTDTTLVGTRAMKVDFDSVEFKNANLSGFKCQHCAIKNSIFENVKMDGARFLGAVFINTHFKNADLRRVDFISSTFTNCTLDSASAKFLSAEKIRKWNLQVKEMP